jgi:hypothetical protein
MAEDLTSWVTQKIADWAPVGKKAETSNFRVPVVQIDDVNHDATLTAIGALLTAMDAIGIGQNQQTTIVLQKNTISSAAAGSPLAQIENKWLCRYHDATTDDKYSSEYPCADLTKLTTDPEFLDLSTGPGATVKSTFEAVVRASDTGNTVVLDSVEFVGRNL